MQTSNRQVKVRITFVDEIDDAGDAECPLSDFYAVLLFGTEDVYADVRKATEEGRRTRTCTSDGSPSRRALALAVTFQFRRYRKPVNFGC